MPRRRERGRGGPGRPAAPPARSAEHALEQAGVLLAGAHVVAREQRAVNAAFVVTPDELEASASARSSRRSAVARSAPCAMTLASIGSYDVPTSRAGADARVDAHARPRRLAVDAHGAGRRQEAGRGILGVQPRLDRMAARHELLLSQRQRLAGGDAQLLLDEVDAVDQLGHRMLDLQPRVHLEEEELAGVAGRR